MDKSIKYYKHTVLLKSRAFLYQIAFKSGLIEQFLKNKALDQIDPIFKLSYLAPSLSYLTYNYYEDINHVTNLMYLFPEQKLYLSSSTGKYKGYYSPIYPALYCLISLDRHLNNKENIDLSDVFSHLDYLINNGTYLKNKHLLKLTHDFSFNEYDLKKGWINGLTQSVASSAFLRAWKVSGNSTYLDLSRAALNTMVLDKNLGGTLSYIDNMPIIEEYPSPDGSFVLNGFISSIIGLLDYMSFTNEKKDYQHITKRLIETLFSIIGQYVYRRDVLYCLKHRKLSNIYYKALHIFQFYHLFHLTHDRRFIHISDQIDNIDWTLFSDVYKTSSFVNLNREINKLKFSEKR